MEPKESQAWKRKQLKKQEYKAQIELLKENIP